MSIAPRLLQTIDKHTSDVTCLDFFGSSLMVTGSSDKTVRLFRWEVGSGFTEDKNSPFKAHKYAVTKVTFSPKGHVIASSSVDGSVILWDVNTGEKTDCLFQAGGEAVRNCAFSPNGEYIAAADDAGVCSIFGQDKILKRAIKGAHEESLLTIAFSKDSKILLTACTIGNIRMFDMRNFEQEVIKPDLMVDSAHDLGCNGADFCRVTKSDPLDSNITIYTLATCGSDNKVKIWRVFCNGKPEMGHHHRRSSNSRSNSVTSETARSRLITQTFQQHFAESATIYPTVFLNTENVNSFEAHGSSVTCVKFNSNGSLVLTSGLDRLVKIWNLNGSCLKTLSDHTRYVNCVGVNFDSTILASGSNDKHCLIYDLTSSFTLDSHIANGIKTLLYTLNKNDLQVPDEFICPITHDLMTDPVTLEDGFTYERTAIVEWFEKDKMTSPMTNARLTSTEMYDNDTLKAEIEEYLKKFDIDSMLG